MLLVGDIGGTKTELALISSRDEIRKPVADTVYPSAQYSGLEAIVRQFLQEHNARAETACFGVAGPVVNGKATITNLPWIVDQEALKKNLHLQSVRLINDLEAIARAVPFLQQEDLSTLNEGKASPQGAIGVIAPGTGLGEAFLTWDGERYRAHNSEGGHTDFAAVNAVQMEMLRYLQGKLDHVSYEWVCSGIGIPNIYDYLKSSGYADEPGWLAKRLAAAQDPTPVIVNAALEDPLGAALSVGTLNIFVSILGAEAGNLALKVLATGGVYIAGGIPRRIMPFMHNQQFMQSFLRKGRFADLLINIPIHVILNPQVGLLGAAYGGFEP